MKNNANRLMNETSPYLLQHAHNPVDWYAWGEEALQRAKNERKPILVSIGYSACHWCHVMEKESFEDEETARIMNEHFVNIKIDREERPDLDHIYMDAVQAMTGSGGWPLNVFLTSDCKPFYGGTYYPPRQAFNIPSWKEVLLGVATTFRQNPEAVQLQAENLTNHLIQSNAFGSIAQEASLGSFLSAGDLDAIYDNIIKVSDKVNGGFGKAPKFPQTFAIQYLLVYYHYTRQEESLQQACLSLDKMLHGGIYDQAGGGFARYSTDAEWLVPHFEKMLYDNALLLMVLCDAWQLTHKPLYKRAIEHTLEYVQREMLTPEHGFYAALDADSDGEEGKFYVWDQDEINRLLASDAPLVSEYYNVTAGGNWEGKNILHVPVPLEEFAQKKNIPEAELTRILTNANRVLLEARKRRNKPQLDDKVLLGWNALMNTAVSKAYAALGNEVYKEMAVKNMDFIWNKLKDEATDHFFHTYKNDRVKYPAFLDDYAYLIQALIYLQEITGDTGYLEKALSVTEHVIIHFGEDESGLFFFTNKQQQDVVIRKKEMYDGAVPSGNAVMAWNLHYLQLVFERKDLEERVVNMLKQIHETTLRHPTSFGIWALLIYRVVAGVAEVVITGKNSSILHMEILHTFIPHKVLQLSSFENDKFPLLKEKACSDQPLIFLCKNYACQTPVDNMSSFMRMMNDFKGYSVAG